MRPGKAYGRFTEDGFQSTHPRGVRQTILNTVSTSTGFQSTHPRGVRRGSNEGGQGNEKISIHAPSWGATDIYKANTIFADFNPRTLVGCDSLYHLQPEGFIYFNPRTLVGCDLQQSGVRRTREHFNPRTLVGCDQDVTRLSSVPAYFNPRTLVGCDREG